MPTNVELQLHFFTAVKELCETHRQLEDVERNMGGSLPPEIESVKQWTMRRLEGLGVEVVGEMGEIVSRCLLLHHSNAGKGERCEVTCRGYKFRVGHEVFPEGDLIMPAVALKVRD